MGWATMTTDFEVEVASYCDRCHRLVPPGTTRPYTNDRRYAACADCIAAMKAEVEATETYCPTCEYLVSLHLNGKCPSSPDAVVAWGRQ